MAIQDTSAQSNRQHAVPQNIMDVEFKIIGDLTMRQFSYLLVLGLLAYFNMQVMVGIFKWPLTLFFGILGMALAFIPVQDRGMDVWLVNFIKSVYSPTQLVWRKAAIVPSAFLYDSLAVVRQELITLAPTSSRRKLEEFLDYSKKHQPVDPLDIPEEEYIMKVRQMSQQFKSGDVQSTPYASTRASAPVSMSAVLPTVKPLAPPVVPPLAQQKPVEKLKDVAPQSKPVEKKTFLDRLDKITASLSAHTQESVAPEAKKSVVSSAGAAASEKIIDTLQKQSTPSTPAAPASLVSPVGSSAPAMPTVSVAPTKQFSSTPATTEPAGLPDELAKKASTQQPDVSNSAQQKKPAVEVTPLTFPGTSEQTPPDISFAAMTPDRHSGRRFTSFLPAQGEIVLPIRGERVLKTSEQEDLESDLEVKTQRLNQLLDQIRQSNIKPAKKASPENAVSNVPIATLENTEETFAKKVIPGSGSSSRSARTNGFGSMKSFFSSPSNSGDKNSVKGAPQVSETVIQTPVTPKSISQKNSQLPRVDNDSKEKQLELANATLLQLTKQRSNILNELGALRNSATPTNYSKISELEKTLQKVNTEYQVLKKQVQDIQSLLKGAHLTPSSPSSSTSNIRDASEVAVANAPALNKPNILWGFVKDPLGKPITDTVVIIKNSRGEPVRATKTNELGQFLLTTSLSTGKYTAEVSTTNKTGLEFDTVSLEASGSVIPPIEFLGR